MRLKSIFFIFLFSYHCFYVESIAGEVEKKTKELTDLQAKIKTINSQINNLNAKKNSLIAELKKQDLQYGKSALYLTNLKQQITKINHTLKKYQLKIDHQQHQINAQKEDLGYQIQVAYRMGKNDKLKLILNQQDPSVSGRVITYYDYLNKIKIEKIKTLDIALQQLEKLKQQQNIENALLEDKRNKKKIEQNVLIKTRNHRKKLLAKIDHRFISNKQQLDRFKAHEQRLKKLILSLRQTIDDFPLEAGTVKEFSKLKGKLPWPVKGKIIKKFASKRSDSQWDGVLIQAKDGMNIRAVTRGRVVYADWLRGYGLLTIIQHGQSYMTLYAFNQSLYKSVGDWVEAGSIIATVGQSGGQSKTGLYFGIRKKGKAVNPEKWCRKLH